MKDRCPTGHYCLKQADEYLCAPGCKADPDCQTDGGALRCDPTTHQCALCIADGDCPPGKVCRAGTCTDGCTEAHGCDKGTCCDGACVDLIANVSHCGACGKACLGGWNCCNAICANPDQDLLNCGGCGMACAAKNGTPRCTARQCAIASCNAGWADCNGTYADGCETDLVANVNNCGACNRPCTVAHATAKCAAMTCAVDTCIPPWADCNGKVNDGCETDTGGDLLNCGGCGKVCATPQATPVCAGGVCRISSCSAGWADCNNDPRDGCEVNIAGDPNHCGSCPKVCASANGTASCVGGACRIACNPGFGDCDGDPGNGCEVSLQISIPNCGLCGRPCTVANGVPGCVSGACTVQACNPGFGDCNKVAADGCETDVSSGIGNCGGCGLACSSSHITQPGCAMGTCNGACDVGWSDCNGNKQSDGCESQVAADPGNCGACGTICSAAHIASPTCTQGVCTGTCDVGWGDCNNNKQNDGCETALTTVSNCGGCGVACANGQSCVGGFCTVSCTPRINELQTGGTNGGTDEFIEIYNACNVAVDVSAWVVSYRATSNMSESVYFTFPMNTSINAFGYYLIATNTFSGGVVADGNMSGGMAAAGGAIGLKDTKQNKLVDGVAWGTAVGNAFGEGSPASAPASGQSIGRFPNGSDTNQNSNDFKIYMSPSPRAPNP